MSRSTTVTVTRTGFDQTVDLRTGTLPAGVTASFEPVTVVGVGTSTLTLSANIEAPLVETTTVTVFGDLHNGVQSHSATFRLAVAPAP